MNRYYFQALNEGNEPVAEQQFNQTQNVVSEGQLLEKARQVARSTACEWPEDAPWTGWSVEIGRLLSGEELWSRHQVKFQELLAV